MKRNNMFKNVFSNLLHNLSSSASSYASSSASHSFVTVEYHNLMIKKLFDFYYLYRNVIDSNKSYSKVFRLHSIFHNFDSNRTVIIFSIPSDSMSFFLNWVHSNEFILLHHSSVSSFSSFYALLRYYNRFIVVLG